MSKNSLSLVEWEQLQPTLLGATRVTRRAVTVHQFGIFLDLGFYPRIPVLLELIHFAEDSPAVGDEIEARILA
jgi:hypothetical protein